MKKLILHTLMTISLIGASDSTLAQSSDEDYSSSARKTMRVIAFAPDTVDTSNKSKPLFYEYRGKKTRFLTPRGYISSQMPMPKGESLIIYQEQQIAIEGTTETKTSYVNVGTIPLINGSKAILVVLIPPDLSKNKIRGRSFKDSLSIHPKETARVFNISPKKAAVSAGKHAIEVPVGGEGIIRWKATAFNSVAYQIGIEGKRPGTWKVVERTECVAPEGTRSFVFIVGTEYENQKTITSTTCLDSLPIEEEE